LKRLTRELDRGAEAVFLPRVDRTGSIIKPLYVAYPKALSLEKLSSHILRFSSSSLYCQSDERRWR
jgi:hypothetical protein